MQELLVKNTLIEQFFYQNANDPSKNPPALEPQLNSERSLQTPVILVVDDDAGMRTMLETILSEEGYQVKLARNGQEALEAIRQERPALILLDLMMPVMNGWQLLEELKNQSALSALPIVLLSASRDLQRTAQQHNVKAYLPKPFELDKLLQYLEQYRAGS